MYGLCDPRDGVVFYVGKGKGRRMYDHARECRSDGATNLAKRTRLIEIIDAGFEVEYVVLADDLSEVEAYSLERAEIAARASVVTNVMVEGRAKRPAPRRRERSPEATRLLAIVERERDLISAHPILDQGVFRTEDWPTLSRLSFPLRRGFSVVADRPEKPELRPDFLLQQIAALSFFDPRSLYVAGDLAPLCAIPDAASVMGIKWREDQHGKQRIVEYQLSRKLAALRLLDRILRRFP